MADLSFIYSQIIMDIAPLAIARSYGASYPSNAALLMQDAISKLQSIKDQLVALSSYIGPNAVIALKDLTSANLSDPSDSNVIDALSSLTSFFEQELIQVSKQIKATNIAVDLANYLALQPKYNTVTQEDIDNSKYLLTFVSPDLQNLSSDYDKLLSTYSTNPSGCMEMIQKDLNQVESYIGLQQKAA